MERITQVQVRIAEGLKREGVLNASGIAKEYGARPSNAKRAADLMRAKGYVSYKDGLYKLTSLGHYAVLRSAAAETLRKAQASKPSEPELPLPDPIYAIEASGAVTNSLRWPTPEFKFAEQPAEEAATVVSASVTLDIAGHHITLTVDEAQELRASLNKFFGEA